MKPHFEFGSKMLYTSCNEAILIYSRCTPIQLMMDTLKWLTIQQRVVLNTLQFIQKMKIEKAPTYLAKQLGYL